MTIYLTIITTALVITQIIRLLQNAQQLKKHSEIERKNDYILKVYSKIEQFVDRELDSEVDHADD